MLGMEAGREGKVDVGKEGGMDRWIERCDLSVTLLRKEDVHIDVLSFTSAFVSPCD